MNRELTKKITSLITNHYFLLGVFVLLCLWPTILQWINGGTFNNFLIYCGASDNFFAEQSLYVTYPERYADINHYGPLFAFIIYPFTLLPTVLALMLWIVGGGVLLWYAIRTLPISDQGKSIVMLFSAVELYNAAAYQQFGIVTAALVILSFSMIIRQKEGVAALCIVVGTLVKIYGIVGLAFFFFIEPSRRMRFVGYMTVWTIVLVGMQFLFVGIDYLIAQYGDWLREISIKDLQNKFAVYQNRGLLGMVRKISGSIYYNDLWLMIGGLVLFFAPYFRFDQYRARGFQLSLVASVLLYLVLFSSGTETCSYLTAIAGVGIWFVARPSHKSGVRAWVVVALVLFGSLANAFLPPSIYHGWFFAYALKALPFAIAWLVVVGEMLFRDYRNEKIVI